MTGTATILMKSGNSFKIRCDSFYVKKVMTGEITELTLKGTIGQSFIYLNLNEVEAVLWEE